MATKSVSHRPSPAPSSQPKASVSAAKDKATQASSSAKPAEAKPAQAKAAQAKPAQATPPSAKPLQAKAAQAKPAQAKPVQDAFATAKPKAAATPASAQRPNDQFTPQRAASAPTQPGAASPPTPLQPPSEATLKEAQSLEPGDSVTYKQSVEVKAGGNSAAAENSVKIEKTDDNKFVVSTGTGAAENAGLRSEPEPPPQGATPPGQPRTRPYGQPESIPQTQPQTQPVTPESTPLDVPVIGGPIVKVPGPTSTPSTQPGTEAAPQTEAAPKPKPEGPSVQQGDKTGGTTEYTFDTAEESARAADILRSGKPPTPEEKAFIDQHKTAQSWSYAATTKEKAGGIEVGTEGTLSVKYTYEQGQMTGQERTTSFEATEGGKAGNFEYKGGSKISNTVKYENGQPPSSSTTIESAGEVAPNGTIIAKEGSKTQTKIKDDGTVETDSFVTSEVGVSVPTDAVDTKVTATREDRVYHSSTAAPEAPPSGIHFPWEMGR